MRFTVDGHVHDAAYLPKDGDAGYLPAGTRVYRMKRYRPTFRLAARWNGRLYVYEAFTNPQARRGRDLLDIASKVRSISVNDVQDSPTEVAVIRGPRQVTALVAMVLTAPVVQNPVEDTEVSYSIVFHLRDGTAVSRAYRTGSGELARGIMLPPAFEATIVQAVRTPS